MGQVGSWGLQDSETIGACQGSCKKQCDFTFDQHRRREQRARNAFATTTTTIKLKPSEL